MAQHLAYNPMIVRQISQTIKVAVEGHLYHGQNKNTPQIHARTTVPMTDLRPHMPFENLKDFCPSFCVNVQRLQPHQHRRNVVPILGIKLDISNLGLPEIVLRIVHLTHNRQKINRSNKAPSLRKIPRIMPNPPRITPMQPNIRQNKLRG